MARSLLLAPLLAPRSLREPATGTIDAAAVVIAQPPLHFWEPDAVEPGQVGVACQTGIGSRNPDLDIRRRAHRRRSRVDWHCIGRARNRRSGAIQPRTTSSPEGASRTRSARRRDSWAGNVVRQMKRRLGRRCVGGARHGRGLALAAAVRGARDRAQHERPGDEERRRPHETRPGRSIAPRASRGEGEPAGLRWRLSRCGRAAG